MNGGATSRKAERLGEYVKPNSRTAQLRGTCALAPARQRASLAPCDAIFPTAPPGQRAGSGACSDLRPRASQNGLGHPGSP